MQKLMLYVHIPFCIKKCAYCDFLSYPAEPAVRHAYVKRLAEEIRTLAPQYRGYEVSSIYFGGGTPTMLESHQLVGLMEAIRASYAIRPDAEISIECNPGTLITEKAKRLRQIGFNRISIGLQSANDEELLLLGRIHNWHDFLVSFDAARKAGFSNINVDLMAALPGQTVDGWEKTLRKVAMLHPEHISAYSLMIEENTPFFASFAQDLARRDQGEEPCMLPSEEEERAMYAVTARYLNERGYERYEISNYAKPGFACRHNTGYWIGTEYLGLGLGASSFVSNVRFCNTPDLQEYLTKPFARLEETERTRSDAMNEFWFLGLRLTAGVSRLDFEEQFGVAVESIYGTLFRDLEQEGLIESREGRIRLTNRGTDVSNYVFTRLLL